MKRSVANSLLIQIIPGLSAREPLLGDPGEVTLGWSLGAKASLSDKPIAAFHPWDQREDQSSQPQTALRLVTEARPG